MQWGSSFSIDGMRTNSIAHTIKRKGTNESIEPVMKMCGAPFVEARTGSVAGFFHLANGDYAEFAAMDDLIAEGYEVV